MDDAPSPLGDGLLIARQPISDSTPEYLPLSLVLRSASHILLG